MTVQTVQNAGITGTGKDNRQSAAARDTFMEMLNTHLNQASDRKNANAGPGKAASQPGQKSGEPVKKEENAAGKAVYPVQTSEKAVVLTGKFETQLPIIRKGNSGVAVSVLQSVLGVTVDGHFGDDTEASLKVFQKNTGVKVSGTCGIDSWKRVIEHMKANTHN